MIACTSPAFTASERPFRIGLPATVAWRLSMWSMSLVRYAWRGRGLGEASYRRQGGFDERVPLCRAARRLLPKQAIGLLGGAVADPRAVASLADPGGRRNGRSVRAGAELNTGTGQ